MNTTAYYLIIRHVSCGSVQFADQRCAQNYLSATFFPEDDIKSTMHRSQSQSFRGYNYVCTNICGSAMFPRWKTFCC